jgi:DNA processing protein
LEQGRDVGAVPGFPGDYRSAGPNALLRQGAFVVESERDIFDNVGSLQRRISESESETGEKNQGPQIEPLARKVLDAVGTTPVEIDAISRLIELDVAAVQRYLLELEIAGLVQRDAVGRFVRH